MNSIGFVSVACAKWLTDRVRENSIITNCYCGLLGFRASISAKSLIVVVMRFKKHQQNRNSESRIRVEFPNVINSPYMQKVPEK